MWLRWLAGGLLACSAAAAEPRHDGFEGPALDLEKWNPKDILASQYVFAAPGRCGARAIVMTARPSDPPQLCGAEACQRLEIRERNRVNFGEEVWYAFSFRIEGDISREGSHRWVIGQWKEETDRSPYLAQRFDDGVFHITVEDNGRRAIVASSRNDAGDIAAFHGLVPRLGLDRARAAIDVARSVQHLAALGHSTGAETSRQRAEGALANEIGAADAALATRFSYVGEIERYVEHAWVNITPGEAPALPDPTHGWVDMVYRIRGSTTGDALVEIWANGRKVVTVTGYIGHTKTAGPSQYFKAGQYRKAVPGETQFWFDAFRRGARREDVSGACPSDAPR